MGKLPMPVVVGDVRVVVCDSVMTPALSFPPWATFCKLVALNPVGSEQTWPSEETEIVVKLLMTPPFLSDTGT
jgi:hypothetical protein